MQTNIAEIRGSWASGYSLDEHTESSTYRGGDARGGAPCDTVRTEVGEALFRLKYRDDVSQVGPIADAILSGVLPALPPLDFIIPMPASRERTVQPVTRIAECLGQKAGVACLDTFLVRSATTAQMKDLQSKRAKLRALADAFSIHDTLPGGEYDMLLVDDLYDTGATLEAACRALRGCARVGGVYVVTVTRTQ